VPPIPRHKAKRWEVVEGCTAIYQIWYEAFVNLSATEIVELKEWQALSCAIHRTPTPPPEPPSLQQAVHWLAQLGGFVGRRSDGEPGATVLWKGFQQLADLTTMYCIMRPPPAKRKNVGKT
jgi:hypothetical protein